MAARSRRFYHARCLNGQAETIAMSVYPPWNSTLLQFGIKLGGIAATGFFTIVKTSFVAPTYNLTIFDEDPSIGGITEYLIPCSYEFLRGDGLVATYANPSDIDVGLEVIFKEGE